MIFPTAPGVVAMTVAILVALAVLLAPSRSSQGENNGSRSRADVPGGTRSVDGQLSSDSAEEQTGSGPRGWFRGRCFSRAAVGARAAPDARAVASALVLLALAFRSGLPTWQVLDAVAEQSPEPVALDLRQVAAALRWGADEQEAWASVDPAWAPAARAVSIAHRAGIAPAALLMKAAEDTRQADLERLELAAAQVGVRLVLPLGLVLLPAFCLTTVVPLVVSLGRRLLTSG